jgi:YHS domain-containing protein
MTPENSPLPIAQTGRCCGSNAADPTLTATSEDLATCPVMAGATVVKSVAEAQGLFRDHNGNRYWFCCASCGPAFDADPDKYATTA